MGDDRRLLQCMRAKQRNLISDRKHIAITHLDNINPKLWSQTLNNYPHHWFILYCTHNFFGSFCREVQYRRVRSFVVCGLGKLWSDSRIYVMLSHLDYMWSRRIVFFIGQENNKESFSQQQTTGSQRGRTTHMIQNGFKYWGLQSPC